MRSLPRQHLLSAALAAAFGTTTLCALPAAAQPAAQAPSQAFDIHVPSQPLATALNELSRQTQTQVFAAGDLVSGLNSRAVSGKLSVEQALRDMLAGSSLEASRTANGGFAIRRLVSGSTTLPVVNVLAAHEGESPTGPLQGYVAKRSATGTKTDTPLIETPQSISIVGAEEIEVLKSQNLQDALGYVAGVSRSEGLDRTSDTLIVRGFQLDGNGNQYRDGTKYTVNIFNGQQEPYGLERIELLKGAASVLYGSAAPGGIINTVSKRPTSTPLHELNVEVGSFSRKQVSGDFGGPLDKDGEWSYRLTFLKRDSNSFVDYTPDDRLFIAPALKWQPNAATSLTILADYQKDSSAYVYGLPEEGTILPNINGRLPRNLFVGEPGYDKFELNRFSIGYLFEHAFNDRVKLRNSLRYMKADNEYASIWISGLAADQRTTAYRGVAPRWDRSSAVVSDTSLEYQAETGSVRHTMLVGFDYSAPRHESERYTRSIDNIDLYNPVYGSPMGTEITQNPYSWKSTAKRMGLYAQDQMKINDKWVVLVGGRYDSVRYDESSFFTGAKSVDNEKDHAFTGRAGLVYLADNGWAPFLSYSESFEPTSGRDRLGSRFKPTTGQQYEAGVRYQPKGSNTMISAAVYQLTRQNVLVADPQDPTLTYSIQQGEVRSRGFELEARTAVGRNANLILAYAYTEAATIKASPLQPEQEGLRSPGVPYNQLSIWGDYNFGILGLPGLKIGAGMRYVGSTRSQTNNPVPAFTLFDAMVSYTTGPWRLALNVNNLTDKTYIGNCTYGCFYGEPRRVIGTATYRW
ncbi:MULTISPECIES: TonB-dependent siderophore receptor [unclassified Delftia]|uniref:TonB-dependent siderophore receptor n=1 Tax=Chryseobacterium sp. B5 TaxID=2050562 RepID=A0A2G7TAA6_9FLAO|nr:MULTISPECIES: TonB-dependent siderophore receptor [unclassified Delftia]AEF89123.1 TonB-dependent siderophore receptor [Delftia sp. Cs1-4]EZP45285.1 TonB-dependent siderophore receptor precursor [Delftia sp. RIT313]PJO39897.1 TonB-dependent siderophore receptor [Delftia acidovorans]